VLFLNNVEIYNQEIIVVEILIFIITPLRYALIINE